jgi:hypothetical protein
MKPIHFIIFFVALLIGVFIDNWMITSKSSKKYPIEVKCHYETKGYQAYPSMDADSVRNDTIWKDGLYIVNKNIIDVQFK